MKKLVLITWLLSSLFLEALDRHPITIKIINESKKPQTVSIEYQIDQHYKHKCSTKTPFVPNNNKFFEPQLLHPGKTRVIHVFEFWPYNKSFSPIAQNLIKEGFVTDYLVIQGSITIEELKYSYDFKVAVYEGSEITITLRKHHKKPTITATHQYCPKKTEYKKGMCKIS